MNILYNTGIAMYAAAAHMAALKSEKVRKMVSGHTETFARLATALAGKERPVWFHAASLGEFEQARPLIEKLRREYPEIPVVLSFFSPSGYEIRKNYNLADVVVYLPFDTPANAKRFVETVNPCLAVFVKYEFWGNYLEQLSRHGIPTAIVSAIFRKSQIFFKRGGGTFRKMLKNFTAGIYVQDENSQALLKSIGVNSIVCGDTRFDRVTDIMAQTHEISMVKKFAAGDELTLIMGSSWQPDEEIVIDYFNSHPGLKLIIAPHEFDDSRIKALMAKIKGKTLRYSQVESAGNKAIEDAKCLIIDCFGILSSCYRYADVAYIGGGFGVGIHNINEAAVYDMPVIFGPNYSKFKEARDLIQLGGAFSVAGSSDFAVLMDKFAASPAYLAESGRKAGDYIRSQVGATIRIFPHLQQYLR